MKARLFHQKMPKVLDYAVAIFISSVPSFAEVDNKTKELYQSITKGLLAQELKAKKNLAQRNLKKLRRQRAS
ncbi:hypothetical protein [Pedobacter deserti]|uniref:hypothetical protein n=1 Tax=Pedobacter deserti TaxID=2817382 RepID=UPI00210DE489|nr:hypothetical protein [Pedobacter sp. SYSU D00382]